MESFGLFNFLKIAFFPSAATDRGNSANSSPESGSAPAAPAFPDLSALFGKPDRAAANANKPELAPEAPPRQTMPVPPSDDVENNRFVALMERHERLSKSIGKKAPRR